MPLEHTEDEVYLDFTKESDGTVTRAGFIVRECPECGELGERKARREGRRRITVLHRARLRRLPSGEFTKIEALKKCAFWEITETTQVGFGWGEK